MSDESLLVVGAGGFGRAVADAAAGRWRVAGFVDDRGPSLGHVLGLPVLGTTAQLAALRERAAAVVIAIGDNRRRQALAQAARVAGFRLATVLHPNASISRHATLGDGCMVMAGAVVGTEARLGSAVIVNAGAVVDHHAVVGDCAHLGIGAGAAGGASIGEGAWLREGVFVRAGQPVDAWRVLDRAGNERDGQTC